MEKTHRITYRFDRKGQKINEHVSSTNIVNKANVNAEGTALQEAKPSVQVQRSTAVMELEQLEQLIRSTETDEYKAATPRNSRAMHELSGNLQEMHKKRDFIAPTDNAASLESDREQSVSYIGELSLNMDVYSNTTVNDQPTVSVVEDVKQSLEQEQKLRFPEKNRGEQLIAVDALDELEHWLQETERKSKQLDLRLQQNSSLYDLEMKSEAFIEEKVDEQEDVLYSSGSGNMADSPQQQQARPTISWMQGALTVISAIISGCLIGLLLLTLVFGVNVWPLSTLLGSKQQIAAEGNGSQVLLPITEQEPQNDRSAGNVQKGENQALHAQSFQYYVLQAGVFTKLNTRDEVITSLQQSGYAAEFTVDDDNRYVVYAGLAASANNAEYVQGKIKGIETYRKPLTITLPESMPFNGEAEQLEQYFAQSNELIHMYADLVAVQLEQSSLSPIGKAAQSAWQSNYNSWLALSEQLSEQWGSEDQLQRATQLQQAIEEADAQLLNYQAEPKTKYLWNVQRELVKSVLVQKDWFMQVNAL